MEVVWRLGRATVRQVTHKLDTERLAHTTVMTIMNNLAGKGLLGRSLQGKAYSYHRDPLARSAARQAFPIDCERCLGTIWESGHPPFSRGGG